MISKCSNIVINRTKFSEFEDFDATQSSEGLKLVGYLESVDPLTGEITRKNVAVEYPSIEVIARKPENYFIPSLAEWQANPDVMVMDSLSDGTTAYRVQATFEGDFIQINFDETDPTYLEGTAFCDCEKLGYRCFTISFARDISLGKTIKVLFKNFPAYIQTDTMLPPAVRLIDYSKSCVDEGRIFNNGEILFAAEEKFHDMWLRTQAMSM